MFSRKYNTKIFRISNKYDSKKKKKNQITAEIKQITILTLLDKIFDKFIIYNSHNWKEGKTEKKKEIFISRIFSFYADITVMWTCQ